MIKHWWELLPEPFNKNPNVHLHLAKPGSKVLQLKTSGGHRLGVLEVDGKRYGIQVLDKTNDITDHALIFEACDMPMLPKAYVGPLSSVPQSLLISDDIPILVSRDEPHRQFLQIRSHMAGISRKDDNGINN